MSSSSWGPAVQAATQAALQCPRHNLARIGLGKRDAQRQLKSGFSREKELYLRPTTAEGLPSQSCEMQSPSASKDFLH